MAQFHGRRRGTQISNTECFTSSGGKGIKCKRKGKSPEECILDPGSLAQPKPLSPSFLPAFGRKLISFPGRRTFSYYDAGALSYPILLAIFLLTINLFSSPGLAASPEEEVVCQKGVSGFSGATFPKGDILLEKGNKLEVYCRLNLAKSRGYNASFIQFKFTKANISQEAMKTTVINETTALLEVENMNVSSPHLSCEIAPPGSDPKRFIQVCQNEVDVGDPPLPVENFRCIAPGWRKLNCTWRKPYNPIPTTYSLEILSKIRNFVSLIPCPNKTASPTSCVWEGRSEPHYRANLNPLVIKITGVNILKPNGTFWENEIEHWSIVVPDTPKYNVSHPSPSDVKVRWTFDHFRDFVPGLYHQIKVCVEDHSNVPCNVTTLKSKKGTYFMEHDFPVQYAYVNYTVEIRMRSQKAKDEVDFWSDPAIIIVTSGPKSPDLPPRVDIGSYESVSLTLTDRDIYVYWEPVPRLWQNGPNFHNNFLVYEDETRRWDIQPKEITMSYAKFSHLQLSKSYQFYIRSANDVGNSTTASELFVPEYNKAVRQPKSVSKLEFANGSFEISWTPSQANASIVSYTIFRCVSSKPRPYQCQGLLEWDIVSSVNQSRKKYDNLPQHDDYQFAVSANSAVTSSGMVWASCTLAHNKVPEKLKPVRSTPVTEKEIHIEWQLDCSYQSRIEGFKITYCLVEKRKPEECIDGEQSEAVEGADATTYNLKKLKPYSMYKIQVSIITPAGESQKSDPTYESTKEGSPSTPPTGDVVESSVTNTSAVITVYPPSEPNGVLKEYKIKYKPNENPKKEEQIIVPVNGANVSQPDGPGVDVEIRNLLSNANYSFTVSACTVRCSEPSEPKYFLTDIGYTDMVTYPSLAMSGGSLVLEWERPKHLRGPVKFFEVRLTQNGEVGELVSELFQDDKMSYQKELKFSCGADTNMTAEVRAVTEVKTGELIYGGWSPSGNFNCRGAVSWVTWLGVVCAGIVSIVVIGWLSKQTFHYLRNMKQFDVKLPPGMAVQDLNGFSHKHPKRTRKNSDGDTHSFGKENLTYQLQMTSTNSDESKDILSLTESSFREKETGFTFQPDMAYDNKMFSEELENSEFHLHNPENNRSVVGNACVGSLYTEHLYPKSEVIVEPTTTTLTTTHVAVPTADLSDSQLQTQNGEDCDVEKRLSPSPTNRLLDEETQLNEDEENLQAFLSDSQNQPNYNNRIGSFFLGNVTGNKVIQNPLDTENLLSHPGVDVRNIELQPSSKLHLPQGGDKVVTNASSSVPDVLGSSSTPRASESYRVANNSFPNHSQANLNPTPPSSSSYVKWSQMVPTQFRNGDAPIRIENGQSHPYCHVGIV